MKCKNCGKLATDGDVACLRCGARFGFANTEPKPDVGPELSHQDATASIPQGETNKAPAVYLLHYLEFMKSLVAEHTLVTCVVAYIGYVILDRMYKFNSGLHTALTLLLMLILAPAGIWVGEQFRRFAAPDAFLANGMLDGFKKKLIYMYAPQIVGGVVGALLAVGLTGLAKTKITALFSPTQTQAEMSRPAEPRREIQPQQSVVRAAPSLEVVSTRVMLNKKPEFSEEGTRLSTDKGDFTLYSQSIPEAAMQIIDKANQGDCLVIFSEGPFSDTIKAMQTCGR